MFTLYLIIYQPILRILMRYEVAFEEGLSLKIFLTIHQKHHPSWIIRKIYRFILKKIQEGQSLGYLLQKSGLLIDLSEEVDLKDLKILLRILTQGHPKQWPLIDIARLLTFISSIIALSQFGLIQKLNEIYVVLFLIVMIAVVDLHIYAKAIEKEIIFYFWKRTPEKYLNWNEEEVLPRLEIFKNEIKLWRTTSILGDHLKKRVILFSQIIQEYQHIKKIKYRTFLQIACQIGLIFLFFIVAERLLLMQQSHYSLTNSMKY